MAALNACIRFELHILALAPVPRAACPPKAARTLIPLIGVQASARNHVGHGTERVRIRTRVTGRMLFAACSEPLVPSPMTGISGSLLRDVILPAHGTSGLASASTASAVVR